MSYEIRCLVDHGTSSCTCNLGTFAISPAIEDRIKSLEAELEELRNKSYDKTLKYNEYSKLYVALGIDRDAWKQMAERLAVRMKLINGNEDHCVYRDGAICENHRLLREYDAYTAKRGEGEL